MTKRALYMATLGGLSFSPPGFSQPIPLPFPDQQTETHITSSSTPINRAIVPATRVNYKKCEWFLFGWVPLGEDISMAGIVSQLSAGSDGLVDISVESKNYNAILVAGQCWRVAGTPFAWGKPPVAPVAPVQGDPKVDAKKPPDVQQPPPQEPKPVPVMVDLSEAPPPKAAVLTDRLLSQLGLKKPADKDVYRKLVSDVWTLKKQKNLSDTQMVQLARKGSSELAPGTELMTVLNAGVAAGSGK